MDRIANEPPEFGELTDAECGDKAELANDAACADPASSTNPPETAEITAKRDAGITTSEDPYTIYGDDMNAPREVFGLGTDGVLGGGDDGSTQTK